ncbi:SMODS domain-containing nucleotidyltransferase [Chryseobacterium chendengshani]|uniref:SMODS domain-containing nucleotidyltransferase n=1 Tax=Chryseobacterium sp. LJ756 TaxID=2864113 RepID=UPI001C63C741|nr:nucleotidyltransferase domain-containing protein [Chryseobacterium sp. LJ756]MBW7674774.1 nucleotidyltransferase domain-containing protein [Chryseobacterium sp. LJ756]
MASINSRLYNIASDLFIKYGSTERVYILSKIENIKTNIKSYFGNNVLEVLVFGSFQRDTILPRKFDEQSDIDILVVFNNSEKEYTPETYRTRLKKFAEYHYSTSSVIKDHPSIVLEMNKIKFDLVPCKKNVSFFTSNYQIPNKIGSWMDTDPFGFSSELTEANKRFGNLVKPMARLFKRWNARNGYPFGTFELEKIIASVNFQGDNYQTGFLYAIDQIPSYGLGIVAAQKVGTLKTDGKWLREYLDRDNQEKAIEVTCRILGIKP